MWICVSHFKINMFLSCTVFKCDPIDRILSCLNYWVLSMWNSPSSSSLCPLLKPLQEMMLEIASLDSEWSSSHHAMPQWSWSCRMSSHEWCSSVGSDQIKHSAMQCISMKCGCHDRHWEHAVALWRMRLDATPIPYLLIHGINGPDALPWRLLLLVWGEV